MTDRAQVPVLLVEDDASMARLLRHLLEMDGYKNVRHVWTGDQAVAAGEDAEIILLDQQLPDAKGLDLLPRLLDRVRAPSVIMVTAYGSESLAATALRHGAEDYLTKDHTLAELLPRVLERVRRTRALRTALVEAEEALVRSERLAAIGELSVTLHHELNNPLMAAMAEVDLSLSDKALGEPHREGLQTARSALLRIRDTLRRAAELRRADVTNYLPGMRMIDLEAGAAATEFRGRAILQVPDQRMARVLSLLLRNAGFQVDRSESAADTHSAVEAVGVTLVVVTSGADPENPLGGFVPVPGRSYTLVALGAEHVARVRAAGADLVVPLPFDPATILEEIHGVMAGEDDQAG